jgi:hypothetical protein
VKLNENRLELFGIRVITAGMTVFNHLIQRNLYEIFWVFSRDFLPKAVERRLSHISKRDDRFGRKCARLVKKLMRHRGDSI